MLQAHLDFISHWNAVYPETLPISHLFKWRLPDRWMRIHSLQASKRYPDNTAEWTTLLARQNALIDHLTVQASPITLVINAIREDSPLFHEFALENIGVFIDRDAETTFQSFSAEVIWQSGCLNRVLGMIAMEEVRGFIIGPDCLIAPYDGGVDVILKDSATRELCKEHFKAWLSKREDGL
jgi:hypothetical protein